MKSRRDNEGTKFDPTAWAWHGGDVNSDDVGSRIRQLRKLRGLTQHQLAAGTHFSTSLIKKVEQGTVPASPALVAETARVLRIKPAYLYGTDAQEIADQPATEAVGISALRAALDAYDDPAPEGQPLDLTEARSRIDQVAWLVGQLRYEDAITRLPGTLHHLYVLAAATDSEEVSRGLLHDGYRLAASIAGQYRQADLAAIATERHVALAPYTGDPLRVAISAYHRSTRHLQSGDFDLGLRILDRAHQQTAAGDAGYAVAIQLHLRSAVIAARAGDRTRADDHVAEASAIRAAFNPPSSPYFNIDASQLNIDIHWCAVPVEDYDGSAAIQRAEHLHIADPSRPERVGHHYVDMARAWLLHGDRERTIGCLHQARQIAPNRIRNHPSVRTTVMALASTDRRATESLANFARWAAIPIS